MKSNIIIKSIFACAAIALVAVGCTAPKGDVHSLKLSKNAYTFPYGVPEGEKNSVTINVTATTDWSVKLANETETWVKIGEPTGNTVTISVDNNDGAQREAEVIFTAGVAKRTFTVYQLPYEKNMARYRDLSFFLSSAISPNGKYAGGYDLNYDEADASVYTPIIVDIENDKWHYLSEIHSSSHHITSVDAIDDNGTIFFGDWANGGSFAVDLEDNLFEAQRPEGFDWAPQVSQVSSDGSVWVGYCTKGSIDGDTADSGYWPIRWENREPIALPRPATTFRGEKSWGGTMARGVSNDGKVMYGTQWANEDNVIGGMISWDKSGDVYWIGGKIKGTDTEVYTLTETEFIGDDGAYKMNLVTGFITTSEVYNISETGKWITGTYIIEKKAGDNAISRRYYPGFYNTETNESTIFDDMEGWGGLSVTDEGIGTITNGGSNGSPATTGYVVDVNNKVKLGTCQEWIAEKFGTNVTAGYIRYICGGGETIWGIRMVAGGPGGASFPNWYVTKPSGF